MEILWWVLIGLCMLFGFLGCFINKFPGPLMVLIATLIGKFCLDLPISWLVIAVVAVLWIVSVVLNKKFLPKLVAKIHEFSKAGSWGCTIGVLIGLPMLAVAEGTTMMILMAILAFVVLPYIFALLFEFIKTKNGAVAAKSAGSAYSVYLVSSCVKLVAFGYAIYALFNM